MDPATETWGGPAPPALELERVFEAPPALVFEMWIDDEHIKRWLPIAAATMTAFRAVVRVGGAWVATLRSPSGEEIGLSGVYKEIVPHERLVFTHQFAGGPETLVTLRFTDLGSGRTRMVLRQTGFDSLQVRDAHAAGWAESFDGLGGYVIEVKLRAGQPVPASETRVLEIERVFEAPRPLVFRLWSESEHIVRWWGPKGWQLTHCEMDFRVGGTFRCCMSSEAEPEHWFTAVYREITAPERLSFIYANDADGHEMTVAIDFYAEGQKTRMKFRQSVFLSMNECHGHRRGWSETFDIFSRYVLLYQTGGLSESVLGWRQGEADGVDADLKAAIERKSADRSRNVPEARNAPR
ncbi:MAG: SRPBCC family protein [Devosia sp.]|nr:SRPBCC family protein [Devosia sp.]